MTCLTIRNVPQELGAALEVEKGRRGKSLNQTVVELLQERLGVAQDGPGTNGLEKLGGNWTQEEFEEFEAAVESFEQVDPETWK